MCMGVIVGGGEAMLMGREDMLIGRGLEGDSEPCRWCAAKVPVLLRCGLNAILLCSGVGDSGGKEEYASILDMSWMVLCGTRQWNAM
jgi:hypothetical protein